MLSAIIVQVSWLILRKLGLVRCWDTNAWKIPKNMKLSKGNWNNFDLSLRILRSFSVTDGMFKLNYAGILTKNYHIWWRILGEGFTALAQSLLSIGATYGNICLDEVLVSRKTLANKFFPESVWEGQSRIGRPAL